MRARHRQPTKRTRTGKPDSARIPDTDAARRIDERYGLDPVLEPAGVDRAGCPSEGIQPQAVQCPYCGETFDTLVDLSAGSARYVEDCQVCCRPIELSLEVDDSGALVSLEAQRGD